MELKPNFDCEDLLRFVRNLVDTISSRTEFALTTLMCDININNNNNNDVGISMHSHARRLHSTSKLMYKIYNYLECFTRSLMTFAD